MGCPVYLTSANADVYVPAPYSVTTIGVGGLATIAPVLNAALITYTIYLNGAQVDTGTLNAPTSGFSVVSTAGGGYNVRLSSAFRVSLGGSGYYAINFDGPAGNMRTYADFMSGGIADGLATGATDATTVKNLTAASAAGDLAAIKTAAVTTIPARLVSTGATLNADIQQVYGDTHTAIPATLGNPAAPASTPNTIAGNIGAPVGSSISDDVATRSSASAVAAVQTDVDTIITGLSSTLPTLATAVALTAAQGDITAIRAVTGQLPNGGALTTIGTDAAAAKNNALAASNKIGSVGSLPLGATTIAGLLDTMATLQFSRFEIDAATGIGTFYAFDGTTVLAHQTFANADDSPINAAQLLKRQLPG